MRPGYPSHSLQATLLSRADSYLVASYLYERMKGELKGESTRVHFCAEFEDKHNGKIKRFTFDGDADALQKAIKRFNVNDFLDE